MVTENVALGRLWLLSWLLSLLLLLKSTACSIFLPRSNDGGGDIQKPVEVVVVVAAVDLSFHFPSQVK